MNKVSRFSNGYLAGSLHAQELVFQLARGFAL